MSHRFRFYVPPETLKAGPVELPAEEAHHALHVARLRIGDEVDLFDGAGGCASCRVTQLTRREVTVEIDAITRIPAPQRRFTLCVAHPNRDKALERILESCVPLAVHTFLVFGADHSDREPASSPKWERWAREACKQSKRLWLPGFAVAGSLDAALESLSDTPTLLSTPQAPPARLPETLRRASNLAGIVGPEGGLSDREETLARARGALPVSLGSLTLRTELACAVLAGRVGYEWDLLGVTE